MTRTSQALEVEKKKTDTLLHQMLPVKVADALRDGKKVDAGKATFFGLSKERPILGDHPKAHILEIRRISHEIRQISCRFKSSGFHADFT